MQLNLICLVMAFCIRILQYACKSMYTPMYPSPPTLYLIHKIRIHNSDLVSLFDARCRNEHALGLMLDAWNATVSLSAKSEMMVATSLARKFSLTNAINFVYDLFSKEGNCIFRLKTVECKQTICNLLLFLYLLYAYIIIIN